MKFNKIIHIYLFIDVNLAMASVRLVMVMENVLVAQLKQI